MENKNQGRLGRGFKAVDKTIMQGRVENLTPVEKGLQNLLVPDRDHRGQRDVEEKSKADYRKVKRLSDIISNNTQAATDLRSVTQLIKRAEQIWVTLLLKPNGDQKNLLTYLTENSDIKNVELHDELLSTVQKYFTTDYPIEHELAQIIKDVLFRSGSYVFLNMSHSVLDHLINGYDVGGKPGERYAGNETRVPMEGILERQFDGTFDRAKNIGYIRKTKPERATLSGIESLFGDPYKGADKGSEYSLVDSSLGWTFTDNPLALKTAEFKGRIAEERIKQVEGMETLQTIMGQIFEAGKKPTKADNNKANNNSVGIASIKDANEVVRGLYPQRNYRWSESLSVRRSRFYGGNGKGVGITYHVPSEACIPVHANGEIGNPFGYILLTDPSTGEFLKTTGDLKFYQSTAGATVNNHNAVGSVNEMASHIKRIAQGQDCTVDMGWMIELSSAQLEKEFVEGFINGDLGKTVTVSLTEHNKKLFLSRALREQGVRCIFVPSEYVTYIATDYGSLGTGRSMVEEAKLHITRLAVLETADALANIENSISHTELSIRLEKQNPDARNLVAMVRDEWFANNPTLHDIIGFNNVSIDAVLDRFKEQSLTIRVDASENKSIIAPELTAQQMVREPLKTIDPTTREGLLNVISGYFNLKRSWLDDTGEGNDFAIEALAEQEMLRNQTSETSALFSRHFSDFIRKHIMCNEPLVTDLINIIKDNQKLYSKPASNYTLEECAVAKTADEKISLTEQQKVEMVFMDFLKGLYVELPKPAVTDTLNKIEDKIDAIEKLVNKWAELAGGAKAIRKFAEDIQVDPDALMEQIKGVMLTDAFERFNLPMPFEAVLNKGEGGGIYSMVESIANLDSNVIRFLTAYVETGKDRNKLIEKLKDKSEKIYGPTDPDGQADPKNPGMFDEANNGGGSDTFGTDDLPGANDGFSGMGDDFGADTSADLDGGTGVDATADVPGESSTDGTGDVEPSAATAFSEDDLPVDEPPTNQGPDVPAGPFSDEDLPNNEEPVLNNGPFADDDLPKGGEEDVTTDPEKKTGEEEEVDPLTEDLKDLEEEEEVDKEEDDKSGGPFNKDDLPKT